VIFAQNASYTQVFPQGGMTGITGSPKTKDSRFSSPEKHQTEQPETPFCRKAQIVRRKAP
jgi:hypothetical protein